VALSSISIESGNDIFVIEHDFVIDVPHHKLIRNFSESSTIEIGRNTEILGSNSFSYCKSLSSITFESNSLLIRIVSEVFDESSLQSIIIPSNVEILGSKCFSNCKSLSSITFESNSRLTRIESEAFSYSSLQSIIIPSNVEILGPKCFSHCESLSSITFESNSQLNPSLKLKVIPEEAISFSGLIVILIHATIHNSVVVIHSRNCRGLKELKLK
jgi:hypothetical protein